MWHFYYLCFCVILYAIPFQEKMRGKNKLVPRLLGVTKESILRVDEKTKEVSIKKTLSIIEKK